MAVECSNSKLISPLLPAHGVKTRVCDTNDEEGCLGWVVYRISCHPHVHCWKSLAAVMLRVSFNLSQIKGCRIMTNWFRSNGILPLSFICLYKCYFLMKAFCELRLRRRSRRSIAQPSCWISSFSLAPGCTTVPSLQRLPWNCLCFIYYKCPWELRFFWLSWFLRQLCSKWRLGEGPRIG